jgi:hypothetical protein
MKRSHLGEINADRRRWHDSSTGDVPTRTLHSRSDVALHDHCSSFDPGAPALANGGTIPQSKPVPTELTTPRRHPRSTIWADAAAAVAGTRARTGVAGQPTSETEASSTLCRSATGTARRRSILPRVGSPLASVDLCEPADRFISNRTGPPRSTLRRRACARCPCRRRRDEAGYDPRSLRS